MTAELQFVWFAVNLVTVIGMTLLVLLVGMVLCGMFAAICEWREKK